MVSANRIPALHAVVFDVRGVLIDWNPRYLYGKLFVTEAEMERFLAEASTPEWHSQHDLGGSYADTIPALVAIHPEWANEIRAWAERFGEIYSGAIDGTVALLGALQERRVPLLAATNWGADSWAPAKRQYEFLHWFDGALVSGEVGIAKPDPAFFELLVQRFALVPRETLYIEDNLTNLQAGSDRGFVPHQFTSAVELGDALRRHHLIEKCS
jgi:2-haloacid dehalogenase